MQNIGNQETELATIKNQIETQINRDPLQQQILETLPDLRRLFDDDVNKIKKYYENRLDINYDSTMKNPSQVQEEIRQAEERLIELEDI